MTGVAMAFLTQIRWSFLEQVGNNGAVWLMANGAILGHRLVVVQERPAFFHMAGEAGGCHRRMVESHPGPDAGLMAIAARRRGRSR